MNALVLDRVTSENQGLDKLVCLVRRGTQITSLEPWIESAYRQLEMDDDIDCGKTDELLDLLEQAQELTARGLSPQSPLQALCKLYSPDTSLESVWAERAESLSEQDLESDTWVEFLLVLEAAGEQDWESVQDWVDETAQLYLSVWHEYEQISIVPTEVTQESILGHQHLKEGVCHWLGALRLLQDGIKKGCLDLCRIRDEAEKGQRLLIVTQIMEQENSQNERFYYGNWN
jgi:hypothetical protein